MNSNQILKIYGSDILSMTKDLLTAADLAERIPSPSSRIVLKPNLVSPTPAEFGATTHPEIVAGVIEYLHEHGYRNIVIAEGSWIGDRTQEAFDICGYRDLSRHYQVPLIDTQLAKWHSVDRTGLSLDITDVFSSNDFLINIPVLKGHCQTKITCALKNLKGLLPNAEKRHFHQMGLHRPIAHLSAAVRQDFIVIDHICGDPDFEEGGRPLTKNCIMAALDPVLADSYACYLLGYTADDVPYIRLAEELGVGSADLNNAEILCLKERSESSRGTGVPDSNEGSGNPESSDSNENPGSAEAPGSTEDLRSHKGFAFIPDEEKPIEAHVLDVSYAAEDADACSACYSSLIGALYRLENEGLLAGLKDKIGIGQGMQGKRGKIGVGKCTRDFDVSVPGCPPDEDAIYDTLKQWIRMGGTESPTNSY